MGSGPLDDVVVVSKMEIYPFEQTSQSLWVFILYISYQHHHQTHTRSSLPITRDLQQRHFPGVY